VNRGDLQRTWRVGDRSVEADLHLEDDRLVGLVSGDGLEQRIDARVRRSAPDAVIVRQAGRLYRAVLVLRGSTLWIALDGHTYELKVGTGCRTDDRASAARFATSPMTGTLLQVEVACGQEVEEGQILFVVEAMKMEYAVRAPRSSTVEEVHGAAGDNVTVDDPVVTFAEDV